MKPVIIRNVTTGEFLALGEPGDTEPSWVADIADAWATTSAQAYFMAVFDLRQRGYNVQALQQITVH
jgi:hypothetical protein